MLSNLSDQIVIY